MHRLVSALLALVVGISLLTGCGTKSPEQVEKQEDAQTIQVYLWSTSLYGTYAPYVQSQLPDVNIEFIVGNNDLDFYKFLQQNGGYHHLLPVLAARCCTPEGQPDEPCHDQRGGRCVQHLTSTALKMRTAA